jgi:hypothetical protein
MWVSASGDVRPRDAGGDAGCALVLPVGSEDVQPSARLLVRSVVGRSGRGRGGGRGGGSSAVGSDGRRRPAARHRAAGRDSLGAAPAWACAGGAVGVSDDSGALGAVPTDSLRGGRSAGASCASARAGPGRAPPGCPGSPGRIRPPATPCSETAVTPRTRHGARPAASNWVGVDGGPEDGAEEARNEHDR